MAREGKNVRYVKVEAPPAAPKVTEVKSAAVRPPTRMLDPAGVEELQEIRKGLHQVLETLPFNREAQDVSGWAYEIPLLRTVLS